MIHLQGESGFRTETDPIFVIYLPLFPSFSFVDCSF